MQYLRSDIGLGEVVPNIATLLEKNALQFAEKIVYSEKRNGKYEGIKWKDLFRRVSNIAANLKDAGFRVGDKMVVFSPNCQEMLEMELAVMAAGGISVPIFAYFKKETVELLVTHSQAKFAAAGSDLQLSRLGAGQLISIFTFHPASSQLHKNQKPYSELLKDNPGRAFHKSAAPQDICLNMYTSGTMGIPKCVQLTHQNILSQQAALQKVWALSENDRFLSYLPWHHSFGGIFERFSALYNGATIFLESGYGKDPSTILENWKIVKPSLFFSVPKVYQSLIDLTRSDPAAEDLFFHRDLKFIFTAASSLPENIALEFTRHKIPVIEGWGLTETSPCCTLTDPSVGREPGVVGRPIPGVTIRIASDGEIQVKGPNVMKGYFNNEEANRTAFTEDGWFCTGDVGAITPAGLKLISRKDRIFKLTNGEKVIPSEIESIIQTKCHYITFAVIYGGGQEYPVALLFPNKKALDHPNYELSPEEGCFCPRNINELGRCLRGCLNEANCGLSEKFSKIRYAMLIDDELSIEKSTLTPSMKVSPKNLSEVYKAHIENLYGSDNRINEDVYVIKLDKENVPRENI